MRTSEFSVLSSHSVLSRVPRGRVEVALGISLRCSGSFSQKAFQQKSEVGEGGVSPGTL